MNYWPGFVDALSTLILSIIFLLTVFMVAQFFLSQEVAGKDTALARLNAQISRLSDLLVAGADRQGQPRRRGRAVARLAVGRRGRARQAARRRRRRAEPATTPARPRSASSPRSSISRKRRRRAPSRRSRSSISRSARCAGRSPRSRPRSAPRRRRRRTPSCTSPISASASTSRWRSACRNCRATGRISSASCAKSSATAPISASSATASCSSRKCSSTSGAAVLRPEGRAELDKLASALLDLEKQIPSEINWVLRVDGHTDTRQLSATSPFKSNWDLSAARAISVVQYLISKGVPPQRLVAAGFGEFQPIDPGTTDEAFSRNRRIELKLTESAEAWTASTRCRTDERGRRAISPFTAALRAARRGCRGRAVAAHLAGGLSAARFRRAARLVARALAQRAGADRRDRRSPRPRRDDRLRHRRSAHALSRPDRGRAGAAGHRASARRSIAKAKQISPAGLDLDVNTDNARAIRFYDKQGFLIAGAGVNPISGKPVHRMSWRP